MSVMLFLLYSGQEPSEHFKNSYKSSYENNEHYFRINHNSVHLVGYTDTLYENIFFIISEDSKGVYLFINIF